MLFSETYGGAEENMREKSILASVWLGRISCRELVCTRINH